MARKTQEYPRNNQVQSSAATRIAEDYIAQVSGEFEGRVTKKLSQEFSGTMSGILGALSKLDEFLLSPQIRTFSGSIPETFKNADVGNQEPSGDRSQNGTHPELEFSACRANNLTDSDPDETSHINVCKNFEIFQKVNCFRLPKNSAYVYFWFDAEKQANWFRSPVRARVLFD